MTIADRFGANLRQCRRRVRLSQEGLAERADLHRTEIGLLERGLRVPKADTVVKLAGALEVGAEKLLEGIEWVPGACRAGQFRVSASWLAPSLPASSRSA